jgi:hypothetical protein
MLTAPHRDPVGRQVAVAAGAARPIPATGTVVTPGGAVIAILPVLAAAPELLGCEVGLGVQQQRFSPCMTAARAAATSTSGTSNSFT